MFGNPLLLMFLGVAVLLLVAGVVLAVLQRRMLREQSRQVRELLDEARRLRTAHEPVDTSRTDGREP